MEQRCRTAQIRILKQVGDTVDALAIAAGVVVVVAVVAANVVAAAAAIVAAGIGVGVGERHGGRYSTLSNAEAGAVSAEVLRVAGKRTRCSRCVLHCRSCGCLLARPPLCARARLLSVDRAAPLLLRAGAATGLAHAHLTSTTLPGAFIVTIERRCSHVCAARCQAASHRLLQAG